MRGLRGNVGYVGSWVAWVRGCVGYVGYVCQNIFYVGQNIFYVSQHFTWVIIFTWVAWVKILCVGLCVSQNFLLRSIFWGVVLKKISIGAFTIIS